MAQRLYYSLGVGWAGVGRSLFDIKDVDSHTWGRGALALAVETDEPRERLRKDPEPNTYDDWREVAGMLFPT
jgi:hypothetical protein